MTIERGSLVNIVHVENEMKNANLLNWIIGSVPRGSRTQFHKQDGQAIKTSNHDVLLYMDTLVSGISITLLKMWSTTERHSQLTHNQVRSATSKYECLFIHLRPSQLLMCQPVQRPHSQHQIAFSIW